MPADSSLARRLFVFTGVAAALFAARKAAHAQPRPGAGHLVLLGDSIFDNARYVAGGPDVVQQVRAALPEGWRATLNALDGAVISDMSAQLRRVPADATHLVVSIGGNDALRRTGMLDEPARSISDALGKLATVRELFQRGYGTMLDEVHSRGIPVAVCTIYEGRFPEPVRRRVAATALTILNDAITREAFARNLTLIDLRVIFDRDEDYANPVEPSVRGGEKLARAIARFALADGAVRSSVIVR
jgi:lysophospholipase L1-like esterase